MALVFLSQSSRDENKALEALKLLEEAGIPCWYAPRDTQPGANYALEIPRAIEECSYFVLLLSNESQESPLRQAGTRSGHQAQKGDPSGPSGADAADRGHQFLSQCQAGRGWHKGLFCCHPQGHRPDQWEHPCPGKPSGLHLLPPMRKICPAVPERKRTLSRYRKESQ